MSLDTHSLIRDLPAEERPRERLLHTGAESLRNAELIAILLRTGFKGFSAVHVAESLIRKFDNSLQRIANAPLDELIKVKGVGRDKAIALKSAFTLAQRMALEMRGESPILDTPDVIADLLREELRFSDVEEFRVVLLNARRRLIRIETISQGLLDSILVHAREVFKAAIVANAASIILAHNHPSGDPTPSEADIKVTRDLIRAGSLLKIEVLDHVIIGRRTPDRAKDFISLRELGYFYT